MYEKVPESRVRVCARTYVPQLDGPAVHVSAGGIPNPVCEDLKRVVVQSGADRSRCSADLFSYVPTGTRCDRSSLSSLVSPAAILRSLGQTRFAFRAPRREANQRASYSDAAATRVVRHPLLNRREENTRPPSASSGSKRWARSCSIAGHPSLRPAFDGVTYGAP